MLKRCGLIFILSLFIFSCNEEEKEVKIPDNVLDKEKFSDLLVDFTLAESAASINILGLQRPGQMDTAYAFNPLIDNNVKRKTYDTTIYFYSRHPKEFKEVYEMVLEKLSKMQAARK
jgi:hypothetical protein